MPLNLINFIANPFCKKCERTGVIFLFISQVQFQQFQLMCPFT